MQNVSRQDQILTLFLKSSSGLSIDNLANELDISRTAIKQHLSTLEKLRLIQESSLNTRTGGRPARSYVLTQDGINHFPKQYAWFCGLLLNELATEMSAEAMERLMWNIGGKASQKPSNSIQLQRTNAKIIIVGRTNAKPWLPC